MGKLHHQPIPVDSFTPFFCVSFVLLPFFLLLSHAHIQYDSNHLIILSHKPGEVTNHGVCMTLIVAARGAEVSAGSCTPIIRTRWTLLCRLGMSNTGWPLVFEYVTAPCLDVIRAYFWGKMRRRGDKKQISISQYQTSNDLPIPTAEFMGLLFGLDAEAGRPKLTPTVL